MKTQRNDPCPCGSGKKYKKCCLNNNRSAESDSRLANIVAATKTVENGLKWQVRYKKNNKPIVDMWEVRTNHVEQVHEITYPALVTVNSWQSELDRLHELIHAKLCEEVHHFFSHFPFLPGTDLHSVNYIAPFLKCAQDWFVEEQVRLMFPDEFELSLTDDLMLYSKNADAIAGRLDNNGITSLALLTALVSRCKNIPYNNTESDVAKIINTLLSTSPEDPTVHSLISLANRLLAIVTTDRVLINRTNAASIDRVEIVSECK